MSEPTDPTNPAPTPSPAPRRETFSAEYVTELRNEVETLRQLANGHKGEATAARTAKEQAEAASAAAIAEATTKANARVVTATLKAHAVKAGMTDLDFLKLVDTSVIKVDDDGEPKIPDDFFDKLKAAKPHYFAEAPTTTSQTQPAPKPAPVGDSVLNLSDSDYKVSRLKLVRAIA